MRKFGTLLLALFLIVFSLDLLLSLGQLRPAIAILGLIAGILILIGR